MIHIKIDQKHTVQVPSEPKEVTVNIYLKLLATSTPVEQFSAVTGIPIDEVNKIQNVPAYLQVLKEYTALVSQVNDIKFKGGELIKIGTSYFKVPLDVGAKRVDLFEYATMLLRQNNERFQNNDFEAIIKCYVNVLSHYFQASLSDYRDYDPEQAYYMKETVMECSLQDVLGFGNFFFTRLLGLVNGTGQDSNQSEPLRRKKNPASLLSQKLGAFLVRFGKSLMETR